MKRVLTILFLVVVLGLIAFWIWRTALLLDENNRLRMRIKAVESERDNIDRLYHEKIREIEQHKKEASKGEKEKK